jgi:hypothetical protein
VEYRLFLCLGAVFYGRKEEKILSFMPNVALLAHLRRFVYGQGQFRSQRCTNYGIL